MPLYRSSLFVTGLEAKLNQTWALKAVARQLTELVPALKKRINDFLLGDDKLGWLLMPAVRLGERMQLCKRIMHTPTHIPWDSLYKVISLH